MLILVGFLYFIEYFKHDLSVKYGLDIPDNSLYGITYQTLFMFGFYFILISLLLILPLMDQKSRNLVNKANFLWILITIVGFEIILYSLLIDNHILSAFNPNHTWFDYLVLGGILSFIGFNVLVFSIKDFQVLEKYFPILSSLIILGMVIELLSFLAYSKLLIGLKKSVWIDLFLVGIVPLYFGGLPFCLSKIITPFTKIKYIRVLVSFSVTIGFLVYLAPTFALNKLILPMSIFKYNNYFDYLVYGAILTFAGVAGMTIIYQKTLRHKNNVWTIILSLGIIQILISMILVTSDTYYIDLWVTPFLEIFPNLNGHSLFGMTWDVFFFNGLFTTIISLIIISLILFIETLEFDNQRDEEEEDKKQEKQQKTRG